MTATAHIVKLVVLLGALGLSAQAQAQEDAPAPAAPAAADPSQLDLEAIGLEIPGEPVAPADALTNPYAPYVGEDFPRNLYWGDLHVHTRLSADAYSLGNRTLDPATAYRYAKGEEVQTASKQFARLSRPLDFLLISDHASFLGAVKAQSEQLPPEEWQSKVLQMLSDFGNGISGAKPVFQDNAFLKTVWQEVGALADQHNEPGRFTAFIGYEWTAQPGGNNLHRNVLFRDGAAKTSQILPFSAFDSRNPEDLWQFFSGYEAKTGGQVLSIPHNGNLSNGAMFSDKTFDGAPLNVAYAEVRMRWEPIIEMTQVKGDGETHPDLSPDDDFADFETWDRGNIINSAPKEPWMLKHEYARSALRLGLAQQALVGGNPFKFGLTGSTDAHNSLASGEEHNFFGKFVTDEPSSSRIEPSGFLFPARLLAASGYTAIWARENTREALFDALKRKEVYATTGPRIKVRFFGGWDFAADDHHQPDIAATGYAKGVPMGGDLPPPPSAGGAPSFLVAAQKDALGANLDRVQIVKGWLGAEGETFERIYNVALSDGREIKGRGEGARKLPSTVDASAATYSNSVGAPALSAVWQDPDFDPTQPAFYYVRALEIQTPRWSTYDAAFYGTEAPEDLPAAIQERAYTSPIWYTP